MQPCHERIETAKLTDSAQLLVRPPSKQIQIQLHLIAQSCTMSENDGEFHVQTSTAEGYRTFIRKQLKKLGVRSTHNLPALAVQEETPTRFLELRIRTNDHTVTFRLREDNLYLIGYQMGSGQWLEFDNNENQHLIPGSAFLGFDGSYDTLQRVGRRDLDQIGVGSLGLAHAINQLATSTNGESRARSLIVVIMMFPESIRFIPVLNYMADNFNESGAKITTWIGGLVRQWGTYSSLLWGNDACPNASYQLQGPCQRLPDGREIRTIEDIKEILGVTSGLLFNASRPYKGKVRDP